MWEREICRFFFGLEWPVALTTTIEYPIVWYLFSSAVGTTGLVLRILPRLLIQLLALVIFEKRPVFNHLEWSDPQILRCFHESCSSLRLCWIVMLSHWSGRQWKLCVYVTMLCFLIDIDWMIYSLGHEQWIASKYKSNLIVLIRWLGENNRSHCRLQ